MVSKRTIQRRRNSKRQKRRSLKRRNVKSRKVMRGGAGDPLENVKKDDLVSVVLFNQRIYNPDNAETVICRVLSVDNKTIPLGKGQTGVVKVVILIITNEKYTFCYVYGGNDYNGIPIEHKKEFEISYIPSSDGMCPYKLIIYKRNENEELEVIPGRYYTHIIPDDHKKGSSLIIGSGHVIKSVTPIRVSQ